MKIYFKNIYMEWRDDRYIAANEHRKSECGSNYVVWTEQSQFWLPNIFVWHALELVSP